MEKQEHGSGILLACFKLIPCYFTQLKERTNEKLSLRIKRREQLGHGPLMEWRGKKERGVGEGGKHARRGKREGQMEGGGEGAQRARERNREKEGGGERWRLMT